MLRDVAELMSAYGRPWWIAGGWALDLHLGRQTRPHGDVDIAVLRDDQGQLHRHLAGSRTLYKIVDGAALPWHASELLKLPVHEIHAVREGEARLEFLLNESAGDQWLFRRNSSVSLDLAALTRTSPEGVPYVAPEVVLLYKAKAPTDKDRADFENVRPTLSDRSSRWLAAALDQCHPDHVWCKQLRA